MTALTRHIPGRMKRSGMRSGVQVRTRFLREGGSLLSGIAALVIALLFIAFRRHAPKMNSPAR